MKKFLKRFSAIFILVAMLIAMLPITALASYEGQGFYYCPNGFEAGVEKISKGDQIQAGRYSEIVYMNDILGLIPHTLDCKCYCKDASGDTVDDAETTAMMKTINPFYEFSVPIGFDVDDYLTITDMVDDTITIQKREGVYSGAYPGIDYEKSGVNVSTKGLTFYASDGKITDANWYLNGEYKETNKSYMAWRNYKLTYDVSKDHNVYLSNKQTVTIANGKVGDKELTWSGKPQYLTNKNDIGATVKDGDTLLKAPDVNIKYQAVVKGGELVDSKWVDDLYELTGTDVGTYVIYQKISDLNITKYEYPTDFNDDGKAVEIGEVTILQKEVTVVDCKLNDDCVYNGEGRNVISNDVIIVDDNTKVTEVTIYYQAVISGNEYDDNNWKDDKSKVEVTNAGKYDVWQKIDMNTLPKQYCLPEEDKAPKKLDNKFKIKKQGVSVPKAADNLIYDGTIKTGVTIDSNLIEFDEGNVNTAINAGEYKAKVIIKAEYEKNYKWSVDNFNGEIPWKIAKKTAEEGDFIFEAPDSLYTGKDKDAIVELDKSKPYTDVEFGIIYTDSKGNVLNVGERQLTGEYKVWAKVTNNGNFKNEEVCVGSFVIDPIKVKEGDKSVFTKGTKDTVTFKTDGPFDYFADIKVNGSVVNPDYYTVEKGSTIVTLSNEYLNNLEAKEYEIEFVYNSDSKKQTSAYASFTVKEAASSKTGDANSLIIWIVLASLAVISMVSVAYKLIKTDN